MKRALPLFALLAGCSAMGLDRIECTEDAACRDAFGRGNVCGDAGYCVASPTPARCDATPAGLLSDPAAHADRVVIGAALDYEEFDLAIKAIRLAVNAVNDRQGLDGQEFGVVACDLGATGDDLDPIDATEAMVEWIADAQGAFAIVGPGTSAQAEAAYTVAAPRGTLLISPSATSVGLISIDGVDSTDSAPGLFWRTVPPDSVQGEVLSLEAQALGVERLAILAETGAYGQGLAQVVQEEFNGGARTSQLFVFANTTELTTQTVAASDAEFDAALVIASENDSLVAFLNAAAALPGTPFATRLILFSDGGYSSQIFTATQGSPGRLLWPNIRGTTPRTPTGIAYANFVVQFTAAYPTDDPNDFAFTAHAHDAAWLAFAGAAWSQAQEGGLTGLGAARGLRRISASGPKPIELGPTEWNDLKARFAQGDSVDLEGASGQLDYDPVTGETAAPMTVWTVDAGTGALTPRYCVDLSENPVDDCCTDPRTDVCEP